MGDRSRGHGVYTVFVFNQATQANSAWPSLRGYRQNEYWLAMVTANVMGEIGEIVSSL